MRLNTLGKTNIRATLLGLGGGGFSRLGTGQNKGEPNAERVVQAALDAGVNLIDTAEGYDTETAIGNVIQNVDRTKFTLSTKLTYKKDGRLKPPTEVRASLEASLRRLHTDHVDIYHIHGVKLDDYQAVVDHTLPVLQRMRAEGKLRFIGITEGFASDTEHRALQRAAQDGYWDVMMIGFNLLNFSARDRLFHITRAKGIGVLCMFAVRQALICPQNLQSFLQKKVDAGELDAQTLHAVPLLRELVERGECSSFTEAAYRFCAHEPGIDCVLSGTGSVEHLRQNLIDIQKPALPAEFLARFEPLFAGVTALSGQ
jgi:aryl-alcohol dehydrogenase-like predicted oxidoreductase